MSGYKWKHPDGGKRRERSKEHFQLTLNIHPASEEEDNGILLLDDQMEVLAPGMEKIVNIIKRMKNGKAGGEDNITAELFKCGTTFKDPSTYIPGVEFGMHAR